MRTAIIVTWPKADKPPVAEYYSNYQEARDASSKLRAKHVPHELWGSGSGIERKVRGGKSGVNMSALKRPAIAATANSPEWAKQVQQQQTLAQEKAIAAATGAKAEPAADPDKVEAGETDDSTLE